MTEVQEFQGSEGEIIDLLFRAAMASDMLQFCSEQKIDPNLLKSLRRQYAQPYIVFLEGMLREIRSIAEH